MTAEAYDLDRAQKIENGIDANGRKWEIHGKRGSALVHAKPNPYRADFQCPKEFSGEWTSPSVLKEKIQAYVVKSWREADQVKVARGHVDAPVDKKTAEESLDELPDEIKEELGDVLATKDEAEPEAKDEE